MSYVNRRTCCKGLGKGEWANCVKKKLRGGPVIDVDPQILRWREKRKKLGLYKPARKVKVKPIKCEATEPEVTPPLAWDMLK